MAAGVNKVILVGHLGADPEMSYTPSGQAKCEMRLATSESWKDKDGNRQEKTEWHRLVAWGKTGELAAKYLAKGRQVFVEGRISTRSWEKDGKKHYMTEIIVNEVQFLDKGGGDGQRSGSRSQGGSEPTAPPPSYGPDDDIPLAACSLAAEPSAVVAVLRRDP